VPRSKERPINPANPHPARRPPDLAYDENGSVSREEYLQSRRKSYARLDLDGDGKLSFEEYAAKAVKKFASVDRDRTGALTPAEFLATRVVRKTGPKGNCPPPPPLRANAGGGDEDS